MRSLQQFYEACRDLSVIQTQREFSGLWGMKPSWFSSTQARGRTPTIAALITFYLRLEKVKRATLAELRITRVPEETEALREGLAEVAEMAGDIWSEILRRAEATTVDQSC